MNRPIRKLLVANRGVPAVRIMDTCRDRKIKSIAVYSEPDRISHHVYMADLAVPIGAGPPLQSYLKMDRIINAALEGGADAIHPGWGFLSENPDFAQRVVDAGLIWIGPSAEVIRLLGDKIEAKNRALQARVPVIPGISDVKDTDEILSWMRNESVQFPIMIKAAAGGGGKGMLRVDSASTIPLALSQTRSEALKSFGSDKLMAEKYVEYGKHIEVQVLGDLHGNLVHLFERECTLQRRNQKIIEEAPSPSLDDALREQICDAAVRLMKAVGYTSAGTVEFLLDPSTGAYYFLEVNRIG